MIVQEMKITEKKTNKQKTNDRRLAGDKKRGQSAPSLRRHLQCIVGKTMLFFFPRSKYKNKRLAVKEQTDELCKRTESRTYPPFSKSGLGYIQI